MAVFALDKNQNIVIRHAQPLLDDTWYAQRHQAMQDLASALGCVSFADYLRKLDDPSARVMMQAVVTGWRDDD